jgi:hypothetical protein
MSHSPVWYPGPRVPENRHRGADGAPEGARAADTQPAWGVSAVVVATALVLAVASIAVLYVLQHAS